MINITFFFHLIIEFKIIASVLIGNKLCDIQTINSNEIKCVVQLNNAGNYPILLKSNLGNSNNDILFKYNLQISNLSNIEGSFI